MITRRSRLGASALAAVAGLWLTAAAAQIPGPTCTAPSKPASLKTQEEVNAFAREMEVYQTCIMTYVEEHQRLSRVHGEAANEAVKLWNEYVADMNKKPTS